MFMFPLKNLARKGLSGILSHGFNQATDEGNLNIAVLKGNCSFILL